MPLSDAPVELVVGTIFLYSLLGVSCLFGLLVTCLFLPLNHFAGKVVVSAQDNLMKTRDERVSLMNEILGAIRMIKFMAWERSFEKRVLKLREKELSFQRRNYIIEVRLHLDLLPPRPLISISGSLQHDMECITSYRHARLILALCLYPRRRSYAICRIHLRE